MPGTTDTVKAILTPGEFVIRKEAVDMIGVPTLEKLNDMPEAGGHSEIDRLIAQATLKNMTGMYGGGMVNAKQYGHGGMVNKYEDGGQAMSNLKPVPDNNPGLAKLPEDVRNKMGYMQDGGLMEMMHGGKAKKKKKMYGYQDGGNVLDEKVKFMSDLLNKENITKGELMNLGANIPKDSKLVGYDDIFNLEDPEVQAREELANAIRTNLQSEFSSYQNSEGRNEASEIIRQQSPYSVVGDLFYTNENRQGYQKLLDGIPMLDPITVTPEGATTDYSTSDSSEYPKPKSNFLQSLLGMQDGGAVQEDAMMQQYLQSLMAQQPQANPFVPFDQRPNQNPATGNWGESGDYMRSLRGELEMENEELIRDKAQNALERIKLDSLLKQAEQDKVDSLLKQGAVEIKSSPGDSFYFPNTPAQDNFMRKFKENMLNPTYFPEGS